MPLQRLEKLPHLSRLPDGWHLVPRPQFVGGNQVALLQGGDELFPAMAQAMAAAKREIWLATYIFENDAAGHQVSAALVEAAQRGVQVHVVIDGFGSGDALSAVRPVLEAAGVRVCVHRPLERWWRFTPGHLRRLHQKLLTVDEAVAFVGGINVIDDRFDQTHGRCEQPRLDFAVRLQGPVASQVQHTARAMWLRAYLGAGFTRELRALASSARPVQRTVGMWRDLHLRPQRSAAAPEPLAPVPVAFVVRDNLTQRRAIEHFYIDALRRAQRRIEIICPYFYPGRRFRTALRSAAKRGVQVRLLLQGKVDYRFAGMAARALYAELLGRGVQIYEYTPAFLHAKVAVVDDDWATVGSSNIDPLSLLLNLEANAFIRDATFAAELRGRFDVAAAASTVVSAPRLPRGLRGWLGGALVYWGARLYLRVAGITARY